MIVTASQDELEVLQKKLNGYTKLLAFVRDIARPMNEVHPLTRQMQAFCLLKEIEADNE